MARHLETASGRPGPEPELRARLGPAVPGRRRVGVEHEYAVFEGAEQRDFRAFVDRDGLPGRALHPTNRYQYLTGSGLALMADGLVAETASPPETLRPGFAAALSGWGQAGRALLERASPASLRLLPGSTHISVETPRRGAEQLCLWYAQTFAPALMLCMDHDESPGALVRPRPGRFELGGEFVEGTRLRAAATFAAGAVIALEQARRLPPAVEVVLEPARQRYGWYIDRTAFGGDLYRDGRRTRLRLRDGGIITAQQQLELCWEVARETLGDDLDAADAAAVGRLLRGDIPLPCELREWTDPVPAAPVRLASPFGRLDVSRPGLTVTPVTATWDFVAFRVSDSGREAVISIPEPHLQAFTTLVREGALDRLLSRALAARGEASLGSLEAYAQTAEVGVFGGVTVGDALLPRDRVGVGSGAVSRVRPGKVEVPPLPPPPMPPEQPPATDPPAPVDPERPRRALWLLGGLVGGLLLLGGGAALFGGKTGVGDPPSPAATIVATVQPGVAASTPTPAADTPPPEVGPIRAELSFPVTTYTVEASSPAGLPLSYRWSLVADPGEECGTKTPPSSEPVTSATAIWSHNNAPPDNCHHAAPDHPFTVTVEVRDGVHPPVTRSYRGSNSGLGSR